MRKNNLTIEKYRAIEKETALYGAPQTGNFGFFEIPSPVDGVLLFVVISDTLKWEHVSVTCKTKTPTWEEMSFIKDMFFDDNEIVLQYHMPRHGNYQSPKCLHLWKPQGIEVPLPQNIVPFRD